MGTAVLSMESFEIAAVPAKRLQPPWMGKGSPSKRKMKRQESKMRLLKGVGLLSENKKVRKSTQEFSKTSRKCFVSAFTI